MKLSKIEILMALAVPMIWGMGIVITKDAIADFPPILLMSMRFTLTAMVMVWFVPIPRKNMYQLFFIAIIAAAIQYSLTFTGLKGLDAGIAALVVQLEVPFLVILGAFMLGEKPSLQKWCGIAIAFIGVGLIAERVNAPGSWSSILLVIGGAFAWALGQVFIRKLKDINGVTVTAWIAVFAAPQLLLMSFLFEDNQIVAIQNAEPIVWAAVVYLGLIMTALGYYFWNTLIRAHDVGRVAPFLLLLPVFAVIGGTLFLGEELSISKIFGGGVVILGVALITFERS
ncbi:MAG: DMT family transporter [Alphaproteobacteria bacterium]